MMFAVRTEILKELIQDEQWRSRLQKAESVEDAEWVVTEYCLEKGYKVKQINFAK